MQSPNRDIKFLVCPRDLEVLNLSLSKFKTEAIKMRKTHPAQLLGNNPYDELVDYLFDLESKILNLKSHHPYKPKDLECSGE